MNSVCSKILLCLLVLFIPLKAKCENKKNDSWFSKDKYEHFLVSTAYSAGITVVANRHFDYDKEKSAYIGIGITISIGAAKEFIDSKKPDEVSSIKDFVWDVAGALTGALIASLSL